MSTIATTAIRLAAAEREMQTWQARSRRNLYLLRLIVGGYITANPDQFVIWAGRRIGESSKPGRSPLRSLLLGRVPLKFVRRTYGTPSKSSILKSSHSSSHLRCNGRQKARRRQQRKQPPPRPRCWHPKQRESSAAIVPHSPAHLGRISPPFWGEQLPRQN